MSPGSAVCRLLPPTLRVSVSAIGKFGIGKAKKSRKRPHRIIAMRPRRRAAWCCHPVPVVVPEAANLAASAGVPVRGRRELDWSRRQRLRLFQTHRRKGGKGGKGGLKILPLRHLYHLHFGASQKDADDAPTAIAGRLAALLSGTVCNPPRRSSVRISSFETIAIDDPARVLFEDPANFGIIQ
jgi:hypothetical protein